MVGMFGLSPVELIFAAVLIYLTAKGIVAVGKKLAG